MKSVVIYGTRYGNTKRVAEAIADGIRPHGEVEVKPVSQAPTTFAGDVDLVVVGGPTEGHGMTAPVKVFLEGLSAGAVKGVRVAAFDTRVEWPLWMSGSAGTGIANRLRNLGADLVTSPGSFIVEGKDPVLKSGELERATAWGDNLGRALVAETAAVS